MADMERRAGPDWPPPPFSGREKWEGGVGDAGQTEQEGGGIITSTLLSEITARCVAGMVNGKRRGLFP